MKYLFSLLFIFVFFISMESQIIQKVEVLISNVKIHFVQKMEADKTFYSKKNKTQFLRLLPAVSYSDYRGVYYTLDITRLFDIVETRNLKKLEFKNIEFKNANDFEKQKIEIIDLYNRINFLIVAYLFDYQNFDYSMELHKIYEEQYENNKISIETVLKHRITRNNIYSNLLQNEYKIKTLCQELGILSLTNINYALTGKNVQDFYKQFNFDK